MLNWYVQIHLAQNYGSHVYYSIIKLIIYLIYNNVDEIFIYEIRLELKNKKQEKYA